MKQLLSTTILFAVTLFSINCTKGLDDPESSSVTQARSVAGATTAKDAIFFYSGGKKVLLDEDTTTIVVKVRNDVKDVHAFISSLPLSAKNLTSSIITEKSLIKLQYTGNKNEVLKELRNQDRIKYVWHAVSYDNEIIIPTGSILLKPKKGSSIEEILNIPGVSGKVQKSENTYIGGMVKLLIKNDEDLFNVANTIYESKAVEWSHPDFLMPMVQSFTPTDYYYPEQWYLDNWGQTGGVSGIDINVEPAWDITKGDSNIIVAVIDPGSIEVHEDLPASRILSGYHNYVAGPGVWPHAQCIAGVIAASQSNDGTSLLIQSTQQVA